MKGSALSLEIMLNKDKFFELYRKIFELKNSINDFIEAIKVKRYAFWFLLIMILFASILSYTAVTNVLLYAIT